MWIFFYLLESVEADWRIHLCNVDFFIWLNLVYTYFLIEYLSIFIYNTYRYMNDESFQGNTFKNNEDVKSEKKKVKWNRN